MAYRVNISSFKSFFFSKAYVFSVIWKIVFDSAGAVSSLKLKMSTASFCKLQWWITAQKMKFSIKDFFSKCVQNSRFYYKWSRCIVKDWDFIIYGWNMLWKVETLWWSVEICHSRSRFCYETVKISWWQVEILLWVVKVFMMTARDFIMNTRDFHDDRSRFLWKKSRFYYERSRF